MKIAVISNAAGAADELAQLRGAMASKSIEATWYETTESDPGTAQANRSVGEGAELVIAVGGDGTVRAVAEGLVGSGTALGVIPAGTGNLLARNLGIPGTPEESLEIALYGRRETLDVGVVRGEVFMVMSGVGLDATIMEETSGESKDRIGVFAYVVEGIKHLFDRPVRATIVVNAGDPHPGSWATIIVGNLGWRQAGIDLFPDSSPRDGLLDVVGLVADGAIETIAAGVVAAAGVDDTDRLYRRHGEVIEIRFETPTAYQIDGDVRGEVSELVYEVRPSALIVMVPEEDQPAAT